MKLVSSVTFAATFVSLLACSSPKKANTQVASPTAEASISKTIALNKRYNIILLVADDLGRNDIGCYGTGFIETPRLDQMAKEGLRFTNAYSAAPLCSPTRASIITGNNPARINLTEHLHGYSPAGPKQKLITPKIETGLPGHLTTIPEALNNNGYVTAHFGKWHLGMGPSSPQAQGFKLVYGGGAEGLANSFFYPFFNGKPYPKLLEDSKEGDYLDDVLTTRALKFLKNNKDSSFFMELNFYAPHVPIQGKPALVEKYNQKKTMVRMKNIPESEYAAMVENIDYNVGRVIDFLKENGLDKNTIVLFTSDNGGLDVEEVPAFAKHTPPTSNAPLRAGKGYIYEGGIRSPWIMWMPSQITSGRDEKTLVTTDDIFNTCMGLAKVEAKSPDGLSLTPLLLNQQIPNRDFYLHFPHYSPQRGKPGAVIRRGNFKLIEWYEDGKIELFDLEKDEAETNNIAQQNKALVAELKQALDAWKKSVNATEVKPNPNYVQ
jgi:arylsulfatase A